MLGEAGAENVYQPWEALGRNNNLPKLVEAALVGAMQVL